MNKILEENAHQLKKCVNKCSVTIRFAQTENKTVKSTVMDILVHSFETRLQKQALNQ